MKLVIIILAFFIICIFTYSCRDSKIVKKPTVSSDMINLSIPLGLIEPDLPLNRSITQAKIDLGKKLFFDIRLSKDMNTSCASCHSPSHGFAEDRSKSILPADRKAIKPFRNAQSIINSGYLPTLNWDGSSNSLEAQVEGSFQVYGDMGIDLGEAIKRIESYIDYNGKFEAAFGVRPTADEIKEALASYQRSLLSGGTRFDQFLFRNDTSALTQIEIKGYNLFIQKAGCITCHDIFHPSINALGGGVALFTDFRFHNLGVGYRNGKMHDVGRYYVTRDIADWGAFKTPSLRNVEITSPYMHDGSLKTLEEVIEFYDKGCIPNPNLSPGINPLYLSKQEKNELVAFLRTLTDEKVALNSTKN